MLNMIIFRINLYHTSRGRSVVFMLEHKVLYFTIIQFYSHVYNSGLIDVKELQGTFCKENIVKVGVAIEELHIGITQSSDQHLHWDT